MIYNGSKIYIKDDRFFVRDDDDSELWLTPIEQYLLDPENCHNGEFSIEFDKGEGYDPEFAKYKPIDLCLVTDEERFKADLYDRYKRMAQKELEEKFPR